MTKLVECHVIEGSRPGPRLLITAGVHGDEFEPIVAVWLLRSELQSADLAGRVTLIPVANPAAFARANRTAEDDLDLARTFPGRADGSITQRIAAELTEHIHQADYYVDLHTGGTRYRLLPLSGYSLHSDSSILDKQCAMSQAFQLPIVWGTSAELQGRSLSEARDAGVPAIYAEHGGGGTFEPKAVEDYLHGCQNLMAMLGMLDRPVDACCVLRRVEDWRPQSGHLQICHPAPQEGLFLPNVSLGQHVERGQILGNVVDVLKNVQIPVPADNAGIVLMLHAFPYVRYGSGLAVVLEDEPAASSPFRYSLWPRGR